MIIDGREFLTTKEAADLLNRSGQQLGCYAKDGTLPTTRQLAKHRFFLKSEVEALKRPPIPDNLGREIDGKIYLTIAEACTALDLSIRQVWLYIQKGILANTIRTSGRIIGSRGSCRLILKSELEALKPRLRKKRTKKTDGI